MSSNEWSSANSMSAIMFSIRENNKSCNSSDGGGTSVGFGNSDVGGNIRLKNAWLWFNTNRKNFSKLAFIHFIGVVEPLPATLVTAMLVTDVRSEIC